MLLRFGDEVSRDNATSLMLNSAIRNPRTEAYGAHEKAATRREKHKCGRVDTQRSIGRQQNFDGDAVGSVRCKRHFLHPDAQNG